MLAVLVIASAGGIVMSAILSHSLTERKINSRHELRLIAKNASEAVSEYGFAQLRDRFEKQTNFAADALSPSSPDALAMPASTLFGPQLDYAKSEIIGGVIPGAASTLAYINPAHPANEFDPLRGQKVYSRNIALYAKATVNDPRGGPDITSYTTQQLSVRDAPLFAHAIFYNLDLEVSPGPKMEIHGPVHTNGDLYVQGISGVDFYYPVSTAKDMLYGWATSVSAAQGSGGESLQRGHVKFKNRNGNLVTIKVNDTTFRDSTMTDWRTYASNTWHGNLLTWEHGIENYKPVAFPDYEPDDLATSTYDPVNSGHALIEPPLPSSDPDYNAEVEAQKMSNKAGLYFKWDVHTRTVTAYDGPGGNEIDIAHLIEADPSDITVRDDSDSVDSDYLIKIKTNAMYDHRRNQYIDILEFNVGKLDQLIEIPDYTTSRGYLGTDDATDFAAFYDPATEWNGIVYFETTTTSTDATEIARLHYSGIRLWGGETDETGQGVPSRGADPGMTFATNNALYVKGHFNADGHLDSTSSANNSAIVPEVGEVPVALFADSISILSGSWSDAASSSSSSTKKPGASSTEVAAAIVSGLIPTDARTPGNPTGNGRSSGGVHNFPRFLESWSGDDLYIRGSLVCLYESETDNSPWRIDYYSPPGRKWGFSKLFLEGTYPPGTPLLRTYRRVEFTDLSEAEYNAAITALPWSSLGGTTPPSI